MESVRVHLLITGKVQGVFFRQSLKSVAIRNNVTGWVRNLEGNRVEAVIDGADSDVDRVVEWSRKGPAMARVSDVKVTPDDSDEIFYQFDVRY